MIKVCHGDHSDHRRSSPPTCGGASQRGEWAVDEALPATAALAEHYHVSQATITRVLRVLAAEGLVRTVPRWGTFRA
jgi:DNA-binding transcriptional regulator YhcF (GntR family)